LLLLSLALVFLLLESCHTVHVVPVVISLDVPDRKYVGIRYSKERKGECATSKEHR
jgi:hypothetical protein